ncbi:MAG: hypothetical protein KME60_05755 [Cyanomargarita calcarea GSE-NOS-MK-12-04C]|jgi:hypothetical protein|uniref:Uncharacterized protein n=1 Tax=Cyanomargarita calcarea GSE-NOS-MK-12-04C TaxID=2839659 RepID=A0A951QKB1_9CYAN|nr:hypothetical protein [Cyanomargarita calcarea GSE-NOS-MK-12-04C]
MIDLETLEKLQSASVEERIYIIEAILQSLKNDLGSSPKVSLSIKPFKVRQFSLGEDINIDREELYAERNV